MNWHRFLLVAGVGLAGLGLFALAAPGVVDVNIGQTALTPVAALALLLSVWVVQSRRRADLTQVRTPDPERIRAVAPPGAELQEATRQFWQKPHAFYRLSGRDAIRAAAVAVLTRYENCSTEEAYDRLERGTWTDDEHAVAFLGESRDRPQPLTGTLRTWLRNETTYQRGLRHSVDAIAAIAAIPAREFDSTDAETSATQADSDEHGPGTAAQARNEIGLHARRQTEHWRGISVVVLVSVALGVLLEQPGILLVGVVGICYAAYARMHEVTPDTLSIERSLDTEEPAPGDDVEVTVRLTNDGDQTLPDIRFVDGVPDALAVAEGSPRLGTALRPGQTRECVYTVTARRGVHEFSPALAIVRNVPGATEYECTVAPERPTTLTCTPGLQALPVPVPLRPASTRYTGVQPTTASGNGTEFYATRLYQHGDDMSRIDWNRRAKTGEFSTVLFREERTATVMLLVDTDRAAYVGPEPHAEHAVDRSVAAAGQVYPTVTASNHVVGIGSLTDMDCWLQPGCGPTHRARVRELLATHPALQSVPSDEQDNPILAQRQLQGRLLSDAQLLVFSPLCRQSVVRLIRRLDAAGYPVTVVSPDASSGRTASQRLAQVGRRVHITDLRQDGIPVVDWGWEESIATAFARFAQREGRQ